jgi:hypothetical protein
MSIVLVGSTSGSVTLQEPAVAGTTVLDLPATSGTVVVTGTTPTLNGITFPATQVPSADANTLDDYEEGTWTPSLGGTTTYNTQAGRYTKVGRMVYASVVIAVNQIGTGSTTQISGLPFTQSGTADAEACWSVASSSAITTSVVSFTVYSAGTTIYVYSRTVASKNESANAIFAAGCTVELAGWYQTT